MSDSSSAQPSRWSYLFDRPNARASAPIRAAITLFLLLLWSLLTWGVLSSTPRSWNVLWSYHEVFWRGWLLTLGLSLAALGLSSALGVGVALLRRSTFLPFRQAALLYVELIRGMPFLVLILVLFYGIPQVTQFGNRFVFGVVALSLFAGAYIAEIVRAGIDSVHSSQWESARSLGLTRVQIYRFVVFPQALRQILPPLTGQFASLVKDSSLLSVIGLNEFTHSAQEIFSATYAGLESFLPLALGYWVLTLPISVISRLMERAIKLD